MTPSQTIRTAGASDVDGIVCLFDRCYDTNGPGLAQRFTRDQVASFVTSTACAVASDGDTVLGALVAQPVPQGSEAGPVTRAMLDAFPACGRCYVYGPIAVALEARGRGIARALASHVCASHPGETGILFVDDLNEASMRFHSAAPFRRLGSFTFGPRRFTCLVLVPPDATHHAQANRSSHGSVR